MKDENIRTIFVNYNNNLIYKKINNFNIFLRICDILKRQNKELNFSNIYKVYKDIRSAALTKKKDIYVDKMNATYKTCNILKDKNILIEKMNNTIAKVEKIRAVKPRDLDEFLVLAKISCFKNKEIIELFNPLNLSLVNIKKRIQRALSKNANLLGKFIPEYEERFLDDALEKHRNKNNYS